MKIVLLLTLFIGFYACSNPPKKNDNTTVRNVFTIATFKIENGWGYDILYKEKALIHQPIIPAIAGVHHFKSEDDAYKIASLVLRKINHNINPPAVTVAELDSLGVLPKRN